MAGQNRGWMKGAAKRYAAFVSGIAIIVLCYYAGELLSILVNGFISPAVMGMMVLFVFLKAQIIKESWVNEFAGFLLDNLLLFFIPVTAGIALVPFKSLERELPAIIISVTISSFLVLWVSGVIAQKMGKGGENDY